ncbi:hypothetical protein ACROYT_G033821 [Oculina patagonica]
MAANESLTQPGVKEALSFKIFKITFYSLILLLCIVGNSMVVFIICRTKRMRITSNLLILNLALCDLITPITSIPFDLALEENDYIWPFGRVLCKTLWPLATLSATSASLTLAFISLDRYRVIMHPFKQRLSSKQVKYSIGVIHLLSLLFVMPYVYFLDLVTQSCEETWPAFSYRQAYTVVLFVVQYGIPLLFMTVMYTITLSNLRLSSGMFESAPQHRPSRVSVDGNMNQGSSRLDIARDCQRKASRVTLGQRHDSVVGRDQNIRATKMFVTVVIVFATCRLPNEIFWLWSDFGEGHESENSNIAGIICRMFTYTNSIFNPVIYWIFSKDFQKGFNGIFTSLWKRKRSELSDEELDQDEKRFHKLSTLSDSISFVWRKFSRSRSETNGPLDLRENQAFLKPKNGGSVENSPNKVPKISIDFNESPVNGLSDSSGIVKKKSLTTHFDDSNNFLTLPSQSRLAKLSEESLFDGPEQQVVKTRRYGTVQPPREQAIGECHVIKDTRSSIDDLSSSPNEVADETTQSSVLAEMENRQEQPTFDGSLLEIKLSSDNNENIKSYSDACEKQTLAHQDVTPVYLKYSSLHFNETAFRETTC